MACSQTRVFRIRGAATASSGAGQSQVIRGSQSVKSGRGGRTGHGGSDTLGWRRLRVLFVFLLRPEEAGWERESDIFLSEMSGLALPAKPTGQNHTSVDFQKLLVECNKNPLTRQILDKEKSPDL